MAAPGELGVGLTSVCIREVQKDLAQSSKRLIENKLTEFGLGEKDGFKVYRDVIKTPGDGIIIFKGMNDYTADSIKSLEGFMRAWWEEAQTATQHSLNLLRPTIRADGAEIWFSWNPRFKTDAVDIMFRGDEVPTGSVIINPSWQDNPWFTERLEQERQDSLRMQPDQYDWIWEGGYVTMVDGAYFANQLAQAKLDNRICLVQKDPVLTNRVFVDIGGSGNFSDAFSLWVAQFSGKEINIIDYYEQQSQPLATHINWLRENGYTPDNTSIWLPHDGTKQDGTRHASFESGFEDAGYGTTVITNQGRGAARARIAAGRRLFSQMFFDKKKTQGGLSALGWYHEKRDEVRGIGLGPDHDWSSHAADAFGLMCIVYETPVEKTPKAHRRRRGKHSWMGS